MVLRVARGGGRGGGHWRWWRSGRGGGGEVGADGAVRLVHHSHTAHSGQSQREGDAGPGSLFTVQSSIQILERSHSHGLGEDCTAVRRPLSTPSRE